MDLGQDLGTLSGFQWDSGNWEKNWEKHQVSRSESEQVFFHKPLILLPAHSQIEKRYHALGQTARGRKLCVIFTIRDQKIRVISGRDMSRKERKIYGEAEINPDLSR